LGFDRIASASSIPALDRSCALTSLAGPVAMTMRPCVTILLSVYNGEKYLRNQLDSFLRQEDVDWLLCWRDDGSTDASMAMMEAFACEIGAARCLKSVSSGPHLGAAASFLQLLLEHREASFIAFADQDDCWLPGKLRRSVQRLGNPAGPPALYCARQMLTDECFKHPTPSIKFCGKPGFPASLTQNVATGNTVVINAAAAQLITSIPVPEASPHD
jgi:hypothetical protein